MFSALLMIFVNKAVLTASPSLPLAFLLIQLLIAVLLLHLSSLLIPSKIDLPKLTLPSAKLLFPVVFINIVGLVFNTLCLRGVEASFFQIARGMVLPLTILVSAIHTRVLPTPRNKILFSATIVTSGFLLGVTPTSSLPLSATPSLLSLLYGFLSSLAIAIHAVLIKSSLPHCNNSTIHLAYWTNLGSAAMIAPFVFLRGEHWILIDLVNQGGANSRTFVWGSLVTGIFGFLLCVAGLLSIKVTSPITHMFSSAARSVLQTLLGVWLFGDLITVNRASSILVILIGTLYYTWIKTQGPPPSPPNSSASASSSTSAPADKYQEAERGDLESGLKEKGEA
jgi:GDP-fucose transporter C1